MKMPLRPRMPQTPAPHVPRSTLTFGLEVTLFTALKHVTFRRISHPSIAHLLADRLSQCPLSGNQGSGAGISTVLAYPDCPPVHEVVDYRGWTLASSPSAIPDHPEWFENYLTETIEFISPPYWVDSVFWEWDLARIFSLRSSDHRNVIPSGLYFEQNNSTSIHVHIGNGLDPDSSFPFHTVRNVAMILLIYEPLLDKLLNGSLYHIIPVDPPRCVTPINNPHFMPPALPPQPSRAMLALHLYRTCTDIISLINIMNPPLLNMEDEHGPRYFKFNFIPLLDSVDGSNPFYPARADELHVGHFTPKRKPPTIEFRQHMGTIDPDTMTHWVRLLAAIVELAGKLTPESIAEFLGLDEWIVNPCEADRSTPPDTNPPHSYQNQYVLSPQTNSPRDLSALSLLSPLQPVGSFSRLHTALESANIKLDSETRNFWRRKT